MSDLKPHQFKVRLQGSSDDDSRSIIVPRKAVRQCDSFIVFEVEKMDADSKSFFAGWLGGVSSWLHKKL